MTEQTILSDIVPLAGGADNISFQRLQGNVLYLRTKDQSLVDIPALQALERVNSCTNKNGQLKIVFEEKEEEPNMAKNYDKLAETILDLVGGEGNVSALTHCITRLRFKLRDEGKANTGALQKTKGVIKVIQAGGQYQVVLGSKVDGVYDAICAKTHISGGGAADAASDGKHSPLNTLMGTISGIMVPTLGVLTAAGIIKGVVSFLALDNIGILSPTSGLYMLLYAIGDGFFYFLPILLGITAARKFNCSEFIGASIGTALVYPAMVNIAGTLEVAGTLFAGSAFEMTFYNTLFGIPIVMPGAGYTSSVFPVIVAVYLASKIEKGCKKAIPDAVRGILTPIITLIVTVLVTYVVIGPILNVVAICIQIVIETLFGIPVVGGLIAGAIIGVAIGVLASRERVANLFGCKKEELGHLVQSCAAHPIQPVVTDAPAPCQEVVHRASDGDFDLFKLIPAPTNTPVDAGPYITLGMCYATHPDTGLSDVTIHRMCIQSRDELSIFLQPGSRHIGAMAERATELGRPLPISVSIGVDPAIEVTSCFEPPTTPLGFNELSIAGALRQRPVELVKCVSIGEHAIANAEYVIEGEILPGSNHVVEDQNSHTGFAMPEFPGYNGPASHECWLLKVKAVAHRKHPIMQTCIGPSEEHVNMAGIPTEASILGMIDKALPGKVLNCYAHRAGGGKYMAVLQCRKTVHTDEGKQRQAALLAFSAFPELKHVILVDEDVDIFDSNDVLWAMNTRFQGDRDIITIPGVRCHPLDPSSRPEYTGSIRDVGISTKTIFDCTVPFELKDHFRRAPFLEVDPEKWLHG